MNIKTQKDNIIVLSTEELVNLHKQLSFHPDILALNPEPIRPAGVKSIDLLDSAINRQLTGSGEYYKYDNRFLNCATLVYGITCNHAFHNGNKRAAFLSLMLHLYKNGYVIDPDTRHHEIYEFLRSIAAHTLDSFSEDRDFKGFFKEKKIKGRKLTVEEEVLFIEYWIKKNSVAKNNISKPVRWTVLKKQLENFNIEVYEDHSSRKFKLIRRTSKFVIFNRKIEKDYPHDGIYCYPKILRQIRMDFNLLKSDGFDDNSLFSEDIFVDDTIITYKRVIYKLSLT